MDRASTRPGQGRATRKDVRPSGKSIRGSFPSPRLPFPRETHRGETLGRLVKSDDLDASTSLRGVILFQLDLCYMKLEHARRDYIAGSLHKLR